MSKEPATASFYRGGKWTTRPISKMTRDELRLAFAGVLTEREERAERWRAKLQDVAKLHAEVEELKAENVRLDARLDATLYSLVLMQSLIRQQAKELRDLKATRGDTMALAT